MQPLPSQRLIDFTVECEVSSRAYYEKNYQRPEWPGGASGVTVAIGYDLGYASREKIRKDWGELVPNGMLSVMLRCSGVTGAAAHDLCRQVRAEILIPWDAAMVVFLATDVPEYTAEIIKAIPAAATLPPDCLGVLFSIGYNRGNGGWTSSKDRYREMRAIHDLIQTGDLALVSREIRAMSRLWPSDDRGKPDRGLRARREREAALWDQGLKASQPAATAANLSPNPSPPKSLPGPPAGGNEAGAATGAVLATGGAVKAASDAGWSGPELLAMTLCGLGLAIIVGILVNKFRSAGSPTLARAKDGGSE